MRVSNVAAAACAVAIGLPVSAAASVIYDNPYVLNAGGACNYTTACATFNGFGDDFAAQKFTVGSNVTATSASLTQEDGGSAGTSVNWAFYSVDDGTGLPGTQLASGNSVITLNQDLGFDQGGLDHVSQVFFDLPSVDLASGSYYFALQLVSTGFNWGYLGVGAAASGAAETQDGGQTWAPNYTGDIPSVAVALYGADASTEPGGVPEPSAWALMLLGFGGVGASLRAARGRAVMA